MAQDPQQVGGSSDTNPYLSRPASTAAASGSTSRIATSSKHDVKHETRLYVGNLHPAVDEYTLIQTFRKHGQIKKLDFLFHKSGPQRGQPRGYAFVEYASSEEARQAVASAHDRTLKGRKISVTFASKGVDSVDTFSGVGPHRRDRRGGIDNDAAKTTPLSLTKNAKQPQGTNAKIAAMEAKLAKLRQGRAPPASSAPTPSSPCPARSNPGHPSLPAKPNFTSSDATRKAKRQ